jgi:sec-independent protein translocase protein TatA
MFGLKPMEMLLIVLVLLLLFGARRIPEVAKGVADGIKTFKKSMKDDDPDSKGKDGNKIATS